jgi:hypothetical protein
MADNSLTLEVWKATIGVQQHFNELGMRVRSIAVTVLGALLAAAGYALKEHSDVDFFGRKVSLTGTILLAALVCWAAFYVMDRLWYHRLLKAAVAHGRNVENALLGSLPNIGLTTTIDNASPLMGLRAGQRLSIFYGFVAVLLWLGAGSALRSSAPYYLVGTLLFLAAITLELSSRSDVPMNRRRGLTRLGLVLATMYFGFWLLTWWFASSAVPKYLELTDEASKKGDWKSVTLWMTAVNEQSNLINMSLTWGIGVPILALLVAGLIYWLYRGFRSRLSTTSTE